MNLVAGSRRLLWFFLHKFLLTKTGLIAEMIKDTSRKLKAKEKVNSIVRLRAIVRSKFFEFPGLIQQGRDRLCHFPALMQDRLWGFVSLRD